MTRCRWRAGALATFGLIVGVAVGSWWHARGVLPPVVPVAVVEADLVFSARLDTGAVVSSINAHDIAVIDGGALPSRSDTGKQVRFTLVNEHGERRTLTARVAQVRGIRTADCREVRYHVYLTINYRGRSERVLTNLNDRSQAADKLLLGRNWLHQGYAVAAVAEQEL